MSLTCHQCRLCTTCNISALSVPDTICSMQVTAFAPIGENDSKNTRSNISDEHATQGGLPFWDVHLLRAA